MGCALDDGLDLEVDAVRRPLDRVLLRTVGRDQRGDPAVVVPDADLMSAVADRVVLGLDVGAPRVVGNGHSVPDLPAAEGDLLSHLLAFVV